MRESVSGLNQKAPVKFNGVQVGYVDHIEIDPEDSQEVRLVIKVNQKVPITKSTTATLMAQGITGMTYVGLKTSTSNAPSLQKHPSEPYPVIPSEPSLLVQLSEALREVTEGLKGMSGSFKGVNESFKGIDEKVKLLLSPENLDSLKNLLNKTSTASNQFPDAMEKIRGAAVGLTNASDQVKKTLQNSEGTIRNLDIALKSLTEQTLPEIYQAAHSLKDTLQNVKEVSNQMKQNPSVIIRGTRPAPPGPRE